MPPLTPRTTVAPSRLERLMPASSRSRRSPVRSGRSARLAVRTGFVATEGGEGTGLVEHARLALLLARDGDVEVGPHLARRDLLEGDRERLAGDRGHLGRHDGAEALAELAEVGVHLPATPCGERDERELRVDLVEQVLDRGLDHAATRFGHLARWLLLGGGPPAGRRRRAVAARLAARDAVPGAGGGASSVARGCGGCRRAPAATSGARRAVSRRLDDSRELGDRRLEVVVHDHVLREPPRRRLFLPAEG